MQYQHGSIVVVSCSNIKPKSLIKLITGAAVISEDSELQRVFHPWQLDTKYYTADVNFYGITEQFVRTEEFNDSVQAIIIHMDSNKESGLDDLEKWTTLETDCDPEIKLLISNYCTAETKISKTKAIEWCLKRGFELIELYPTKEEEEDEDEDDDVGNDIMKDKVGVERIIEALQSHIWPHLRKKGESTIIGSAHMETNDLFSNPLIASNSSSILQDETEQPMTTDAVEQFAHLLSQLCLYKESMKSLSRNQRKQCAEEIATAFWNAMGGDEEEVTDI